MDLPLKLVFTHRLFQFPPNATKPDLVLGTRMEPGKDQTHFCMPTSVAVSESTGNFFVADGYCNSRVMKFNKDGKLIKIISNEPYLSILLKTNSWAHEN